MRIQDITSVDWSFGLSEFGDIVQGDADISQCVLIIVTTQKGSDPLRPDFGVDLLSYIDKPINIAAANLTRDIAEQVNRWEPRISVKNIEYSIDVSHISFKITWVKPDTTEGFARFTYKVSA